MRCIKQSFDLSDEQHTGIILTSEVCVRGERSGESCNGRRQMYDRPVERTVNILYKVEHT
jgi:hypothetical protein